VLHDGGIPGEAAVVPSRGAPVHLDEGPGVGEPGLGEFRIRQDTVVPVSPGDVFVSETLRGTLIVRAGGDEVRLSGDQDELPILVREGSTVRLRPRRGARDADVLLELPVWMPLSIRSRDLDVSVADHEAQIRIETLSGDVRIDGVNGTVEARTVNGEVEVRGTEGDMDLFTADGDVRVIGHRGRLRVESTDGDLTLRDVEGRTLGASTLDGDVEFDGAVEENGSLDLSAHDGDVTVVLPATVQAEVEVSTFHGEFTSDFRVRTGGFRAGEPLRFQIGNGGTRIMLRSFDGDISIHSR
jgi:DUF4097 and DUF4098 domain-containing protein YvlB